MSRRKANQVTNICIHCSAGFGSIQAIQNFWRTKWRNPYGYSIFIEVNGTCWYLTKKGTYTTNKEDLDLTLITNGVGGFNTATISIAYQGGVRNTGTKKKPVWVAEDTRTDAQKEGINEAIQLCIEWLQKNGKDVKKNLGIVGHFDFSKDKNNSGVIDSWERIKACPSYEVLKSDEHFLYSSRDRVGKLPTQE